MLLNLALLKWDGESVSSEITIDFIRSSITASRIVVL